MGLRRSGSLSKNSNNHNNNSHNTYNPKHNEPKSSHSDSLLSLLSPKSDDGFPSNSNPLGNSNSNNTNNNNNNSSGSSTNNSALLKRNNSTSTNNSSFSDDSVIIRRTNSLNSDKSYANSYDAISPSLQNTHDMSEEYNNNNHNLYVHDIEEDDNDEDPFENELLLQDPPLSPPKELHPGRLYALYEFSGPDPSQCDLEYDDAVILLNDDDSYWWLIKKVKDGKIGFAPAECLETPGERLARLNCWKNEELERIAKEENKKKSKSLLSLSRKASKLTSSSSNSNNNINSHSNNSSNHDLLHHHRSLRKKSSSKSVVFSDNLSYSDPAYFTDSEPSDEDYEEDSEPEDDEENIADDVDYSDDNDTLDGISTGDSNSTNKIQSIEEEETDKESVGDEVATEVYVSNPGSPDITSPLVVSKIRKKSVDNLKNASLFKSDTNNKNGVGKRAPTPPAIKTNSKDQPALLDFANEPTPEMSNNNESNNDNNSKLSVENGSLGKNLQRNSMLSISDDDASLYNRSSSMYDGESVMFRRSQDLDTMLNSTPMSYQITQTPTAFSSNSNSNTNNNNNNNNNSAITTPPGVSSASNGNINGNNNTAAAGNNNNIGANVNGTNNNSNTSNNGNPLAAPLSVFTKRTNSMAGSIKTVSSTYSIGEYSPSSSEFESDSNSNSNNQTPTKFTALNALQLSSSTINNGGLKGKISNSSSINQLGSGGLAGAAGIITSNGNTTGLFGTNVHSNNNSRRVISDNDNYKYNDKDAGEGDEYVSDITDNVELDSGYSTDNYNNSSIKEDDNADRHAQGKNKKSKTNPKKHQKIDISDAVDDDINGAGNDVGIVKELLFTKKRSPQKISNKNDSSGVAVDDGGAKRTLGSPVNLVQNSSDSNIAFDNPMAESHHPHYQNAALAAITSNVLLPTNESKDVFFDTNNDIANDTISEIDKQLKEMTTSSINSDNAADTNTADTSFENEKDSHKINEEKQQHEENSKHQQYSVSNAPNLTSLLSNNSDDLGKASNTAKPKLLLSPSKSLSKSRNENRLEKVNFDDDEWGLDFENDNDNDNDTLKRTSSPSLASNATSITGGLSNNNSNNNSNSNSVNASIALSEQNVSMANASASMATQSQTGHPASGIHLNSTTTSNISSSPKSSSFATKDNESNVNNVNAEDHNRDIEHEDVNDSDADNEHINSNITPDSTFFTNSSSSLVHDDTFKNLTKKGLASVAATSTKTTTTAFDKQSNNERDLPASSFSTTSASNNASNINGNHINHNRNNSSTYFNRTNSLSDNSESVESHITPITSTLIDSDIHKKTAIAASGSQINNVHNGNDFVYGVNVNTVSNNNNGNAEYANYINRSESAVNANSNSNNSKNISAFGSTSGNVEYEEDYDLHPGMESFVSNSSFVSGSGSGTTATIASTATANSVNGQQSSRNHHSNNGNSINSTNNPASTDININNATRGLISTTTTSMTTTTTNNTLLDPKHSNNSNAMFGLLENQSFSSLLEGYHPEVNDLFGLVFNKADSIEAQLDDLKKLLIG